MAGLPRWRTAPTPDRGPVTLLVDSGHRTGLVLLRSSPTGWYATYHGNHHTHRRQRLAKTNPFYDDGIYAEMAKIGMPDPVSLPIPPNDPASTFWRIEAMRDEQLLAHVTVRRFTDRLDC